MTTTIHLTLNVEVDLNGADPKVIEEKFRQAVEQVATSVSITQGTDASLCQHSISTGVCDDLLSEEVLADFMLDRIENGQLDLSDIPVRLARYGLMDPVEFSNEMRERMEAMADEGGPDFLRERH